MVVERALLGKQFGVSDELGGIRQTVFDLRDPSVVLERLGDAEPGVGRSRPPLTEMLERESSRTTGGGVTEQARIDLRELVVHVCEGTSGPQPFRGVQGSARNPPLP